MSIGSSGRIVIEIEPKMKQELHTVLRLEGTNLKAWFVTHVEQLLAEKGPQSFPFEGRQLMRETHQ